MLSKNEQKLLRNLSKKKFREKHGMFFIEGRKLLGEAMATGQEVRKVFCLEEEAPFVARIAAGIACDTIDRNDLRDITQQVSPAGILALLSMPERTPDFEQWSRGPVLLLDGIRDPGNLGTILRSADWFGVRHVLCSKDCVDAYNPKAVQSSMGSLFRVKVHCLDLVEAMERISGIRPGIRLAGASLDGEAISATRALDFQAFVVGSESHGIRNEVLDRCTHRLRIPGGEGTESLNASVAASILLYQWLSPRS